MNIAKIASSLVLAFGLCIIRIDGMPSASGHTDARTGIHAAPRLVSWQMLGRTVVDFKVDWNVIRLAGADNFRQLKLSAVDAPIEIVSMDVVYENGGHDDMPVRQVIPRGGESRAIDLRDASRRIQQVSFVYHSVPGSRSRQAKLTLLGTK
ncbi:MAG: hypothetical protein H7Z72_10180 [Bacteroidetes bacterium]|nr:hypothetical protein [Fibrella sp.]